MLDYFLLHILLVVKFNGLTKSKGDVEHFASEEMEMHGSIQTNINNVIAQSSIRMLAATQHPFSLFASEKQSILESKSLSLRITFYRLSCN